MDVTKLHLISLAGHLDGFPSLHAVYEVMQLRHIDVGLGCRRGAACSLRDSSLLLSAVPLAVTMVTTPGAVPIVLLSVSECFLPDRTIVRPAAAITSLILACLGSFITAVLALVSRDTERFKASRNAVFGSCSALVAIQTLESERRQRSFARAEVFRLWEGR